MRRNAKTKGFTVVEIVATIVIIGILTSVVAVVYPNYLKQTRDSQRKSDLEQISAALNAYALKNGNYMGAGSNCGYQNNGSGWYSKSGDSNYITSINQCLKNSGQLKDAIVDPSKCVAGSGGVCGSMGGNPVTAYMKATCTKNGQPTTYVMAHLESASPASATEVDSLCDPGSMSGFSASSQKWGTLYGMNYYKKVK